MLLLLLEYIHDDAEIVKKYHMIILPHQYSIIMFITLLYCYYYYFIVNYSTITLQNFSVNFVQMSDLHREYGEDGNRFTNRTDLLLREKTHQNFIGYIIRQSYDQYLAKTKQSALTEDFFDNTPWFDIFRDEFIKTLNISEHETLMHPVACVSVLSSEEVGDPIQILKGLFDPDKPPRLFKDLMIDSDILQIVIMVHDQSSQATSEKANSIFNKVKEKYTASSCRMLILNSRDDSIENIVEDIWSSVLPRRQLYQKRVLQNIVPTAFHLSKQDLQYIGSTADFILNQVVISMDTKIKNITNTVLANKKGLKNTIKSWFSKKSKAEEEGISPEMQLRRLADLLFMIREYDEAYSIYKLISGDFKNKEVKNYAGCMEFMAICTLLSSSTQGGGKKEVESNLEAALTAYKNAAQPSFVLRSLLFQACMYKSKALFKRAGEIFTRASNVDENNFLQAALFFEQTALCFKGPMDRLTRKSALFLILAGYRFSHTDQIKHSFRCYRTAFRIYNNKEWLQIYEHMSFTLGRLASHMRDLKSSVEFFHEFMTVCKQGPEYQTKFMEEFSQTVTAYLSDLKLKGNSDAKLDFLDIPKINPSAVRVLLNSQYGEPVYTDTLPDEEWAKLEETLVKKVRGPIVFFKWEKPSNDMKRIEPTVVGEPIYVEIKLTNTLSIPVQVRDMALDAFLNSKTLPENDRGFTAEPLSVVIQPLDSILVRLKITPTQTGDLSIRGVRWKVLNNIHGFKLFQVRGRRLNDTKQQRTTIQYEQDNRLNLKVVAPTPLLDVKFTENIEVLWNGELKKTKMIVSNVGNADLINLKLKLNHPSIYYLSDDLSLNDYTFIENAASKDETFISNTFGIERDFTFYDIAERLKSGESIEIPVFVRGSFSGIHDSKFLFYYEPTEKNDDLKYRLHRFHTTLKVLDSLKITTFCDSTYTEPNSFICGLKLQNFRPDHFVQLDQLVSVSPLWEIEPVVPPTEPIIVLPKESFTLYLKLNKNVTHEKKVKTLSTDVKQLTEVELIHRSHPVGGCNRIIDTTMKPYLQFLFSESKKHELTFYGRTLTTEKGDELVDIEEQLNTLSLQVIWRSRACNLGITYHSKVSFLPHTKKPKRSHPAAKFPSKENLVCPIEVILEYEKEIIHQFTPSQPSCTVDIIVKLMNVSPDMVTDFTLELIPPFASLALAGNAKLRAMSTATSSASTITISPQNFYLWSGPTRIFLKDVKPGSDILSIPVRATFFSPGIFNLNQFRISWKFLDSGIARVIPHSFIDEQYLISVTQPPSTQPVHVMDELL